MIDDYSILPIGTIDAVDPMRDAVEATATKGGGNCYRSSDRHEVQQARDGYASWRSQHTHGPLLAHSLRTSCEAQAP